MTAEGLRDFSMSQDAVPFFGKENRGICSFGVFAALEADTTGLLLKDEGRVDYETFLNEWIGETPYLLQRLQRNHAFFDRYTDGLGTVRVCILLTDDGIKIPFTVLKLPARKNLADSFWRPGNAACDVEPETGRIRTVRTKDAFGTRDHSEHPETGATLLGERLPMWDRIMDLAKEAASIFQPVRYQSMDIAISDDGPVLIEVNTGGGFDLPQLASGRGFLTDDVSAFFRHCGYTKL